ncbi:glucan endo-1,3-beta-D-glucosidase-like [Olea europaea var. sylvestris]|uniref:glucan endo-1,3-beta-D-glucosidase-like n=1 Tax=Olea europaea var. sylvestris TaxID=158386 RepID=UPI000C1D14A3|nr:glucan endo-1,3-beta-D-glucosidase-like [Olea europaea var. sylvestris]
MAAFMQKCSLTFLVFLLLQNIYSANSQSYIGVNYGDQALNIPQPGDIVNLLKTTTIAKVRLLGSSDESTKATIKAFANTNIGLVIGLDNSEIRWVATGQDAASQWVNSNVMPYYPASKLMIVTVGNEVLTSAGDEEAISSILPAMKNIQNALNTASLGGKIKVTTVHSMDLLTQFSPPSSAAFNDSFGDTMKALLQFQSEHGSPFMINASPFYAYKRDPKPEALPFCLFQPNSGQVDSKNNIEYMNMFDLQVDAVHSALIAMGYKDMEIVVAQTGWPYQSGPNEVGPSLDNAKAYVGNLINHLRSNLGTPLMPGKTVDTYIYELYDEDLKLGPKSEQSFGLFGVDGSPHYDTGLFKSSKNSMTPTSPASPKPAPAPTATSTPKLEGIWCVPKPAGVTDAQLQENITFACSKGIDCSPIQKGGACFEPNTLESHASYVMNLLYQTTGRNPWSCDFFHTATLTTINPSYKGCIYPSG